jgi:hypothetical protein
MKVSKTNHPKPVQGIQKGQLWKLKRRYVYIVALMDSIIQFKLMDSPNETRARTLTSGIDTLSRYLLTRRARVVNHLIGNTHCLLTH